MARIKLEVPTQFQFQTTIAVRITDINYGNHVGNDAVLSLIHEARMQFLQSLGYSELSLAGAALIMNDVAIQFRKESFYGDVLKISVTAADISTTGFDIFYKIERTSDDAVIAFAKTGMTCFDYEKRKVMAIPAEAAEKLSA